MRLNDEIGTRITLTDSPMVYSALKNLIEFDTEEISKDLTAIVSEKVNSTNRNITFLDM